MIQVKDKLWEAIGRKQYIVNNQSTYNYNVEIETKHRTKVGPFNGHPKYSYHTETRFNHTKYNNDLAEADAQISECKKAIQNKLKIVSNDVEVLSNEAIKYSINKDNESVKTQINEYYSDYYKITQINSSLNYTIQNEKSKLTYLTQQFNNTRNKVSSLPSLIQSEKTKYVSNQQKLEESKIVNDELSLELEKQNKENYDFIQSITPKERSFFLAEMIDQPEAISVVNIIKSLGFDATCLAFIGCEQKRSDLFDLALKYSADCTSTKIEGATILQHVIKNGLDVFTMKILNNDKIDLCATLALALEQNDTVTIEKLFGLDVNLSYQKIHGYTLLQYAICSNRKDIAAKILEINPNSADILTANGESAFLIALRSASLEIIQLVAKHSNVAEEAKRFIEKNESFLLSKIFNSDIIDTKTKEELHSYEKQENHGHAIEVFTNTNHNIDIAGETTTNLNDYDLNN